MTPLKVTIPGEFDREENYRRTVKDLAWEAVESLPKSEWRDWPADSVSVEIRSFNTMSTRRESRLLLNMLRGVVFRQYAAVSQLLHSHDESKDPAVYLELKRVTYDTD